MDSETVDALFEMVSILLVGFVLIMAYAFLMFLGFWSFAPMVICLIYSGGDLPLCSLGFFDKNGMNGFQRITGNNWGSNW